MLNPQPRQWLASLQLDLARRGEKTVLVHCRHDGPLRVQRPFYPGAARECHLYLLHPPGGMVTGDVLDISVSLGAGTLGLLTTPAAGKVYRGDASRTRQQQVVACRVGDGAVLEWLPQETIIFDGARSDNSLAIYCRGEGRFCAWDIVCLGRPASGETFAEGYSGQQLQVFQDDMPVYMEKNRFDGGAAVMGAPWGLRGQPVAGTLVARATLTEAQLEQCREPAQPLVPAELFAVTTVDGLVIGRYIGGSTATCRRLFTRLWQLLRPLYAGVEADCPRIWNT